MMTKQFKVGDKVRILDVDGIIGGDKNWNDGDITEVMAVDDYNVWLERSSGKYSVQQPFLRKSELRYIELISPKPSKSERISLLESQVADLQAKVDVLQKRRKPAVALTQAPTIHNVTVNLDYAKSAAEIGKLIMEGLTVGLGAKPSPNQQRKAVIDRAKAFVAEWESKCGRKVSYVVNAEKRTVVALKHRMFFGIIGEVIGRGIAKCAPDDVFNADIGKAIALGRALGLDISGFTNAVKPTEVVVGHTAKWRGRLTTITKLTDNMSPKRYPGQAFYHTAMCGWLAQSQVEIIDDTEAQY